MAHSSNAATATGNLPFAKLASLHVPVLAAFAVAQPLFDLTARHPQLYASRGSEPLDLVLLAALLGLGLPLALGGFELAAGLGGRRARHAARELAITVLVATAALPAAAGAIGLSGAPALAAALAAGTGFTFAYRRWAPLRSFLSVLVVVLVVFPAWFLSQRPIRQMVWPRDDFPRPEITVANEVPVVVVVLDELPLSALLDADLRIDASQFPHFAELARETTWFRQASTVSDTTPHALAALLTGRYPEPDDRRAATLANFPENLFTLLGPALPLQVEERSTRLCPEEYRASGLVAGFTERNLGLYHDLLAIYLHLVTPPPWNERLPVINATWRDFWQPPPLAPRSNSRRQRLDAFLDGLAAEPRGLHFLHLLLPHFPWEYLPSGQVYNDGMLIPGWEDPILKNNLWQDDPWVVESAYQRFLAQLTHTDRWLGEILGHLRRLGLYEPALLVVTADHGAVFRPAERKRGSAPESFESEVMPVPLFVKLPHQQNGAVSDRNVEMIDLLPTIAEVLGVTLPWPVNGESVFADGPGRSGKLFFASRAAARYQPHRAPPRLAGLERIVSWKLATFTGGAGSPDGLFHFGPHHDLVGRPLTELAVAGTSELRTVLLRSELYRDVDPDGSFVPAYVLGEVRGAAGDRRHQLAIAVNGRVRAVTRSYRAGVEERFAALVGSGAFRAGANDVAVLEIRNGAGRPILAATDTLGRAEARQARFHDLQESTSGWRFVVPLDAVRALHQAELRLVHENGEPALEIVAVSFDPAVAIPLPDRPDLGDVLLRLTVDSPAATELKVLYLTAEDTVYRPPHSRSHPLRQGRNTVIVELRDEEIRGPLRLDPGTVPGRYVLQGIELRGGPAGEPLADRQRTTPPAM